MSSIPLSQIRSFTWREADSAAINRGSSVIENRRLINLVVEVGCYPPPAEPLFRVLVLASSLMKSLISTSLNGLPLNFSIRELYFVFYARGCRVIRSSRTNLIQVQHSFGASWCSVINNIAQFKSEN